MSRDLAKFAYVVVMLERPREELQPIAPPWQQPVDDASDLKAADRFRELVADRAQVILQPLAQAPRTFTRRVVLQLGVASPTERRGTFQVIARFGVDATASFEELAAAARVIMGTAQIAGRSAFGRPIFGTGPEVLGFTTPHPVELDAHFDGDTLKISEEPANG